jgi:hypothetical protein
MSCGLRLEGKADLNRAKVTKQVALREQKAMKMAIPAIIPAIKHAFNLQSL